MSARDSLVSELNIELTTEDCLYCTKCKKNFNQAEEFCFHRVICHNCFNCCICDDAFESISERNEHELYKHYPLKCYNCNESFMCNHILNKHILILHDCKVCDFCLEKVHPKEHYLEHLSYYHRIKSTLHYSEINGSYLILDAQDETNFRCKLCNEAYPIEMFYTHFTIIHSLKIQILLNIVHKMNIKDYIKGDLYEINIIALNAGNNLVTNNIYAVNTMNDVKRSILKSSNICKICHKIYNVNTPKEFHDIYCGGQHHCRECDLTFNAFNEKQCHINNSHFVHCPLGCQNIELAIKDLKDHCMKIHRIVTCKYCGIFVSGVNAWLSDHLKAEHSFKSDIIHYYNNDIFIIENHDIKCALCKDYLTNIIHNLEKVVKHFSNYHGLCIKNIENLLVMNPLLKSHSAHIQNSDVSQTCRNIHYSDNFNENQLYSMAGDRMEKHTRNESNILLKENFAEKKFNVKNSHENIGKSKYNTFLDGSSSENNTLEKEHENTLQHTIIKVENLSAEDASENTVATTTISDIDGHRDINFSEVQCIFSDTSDDAMSDTEITKSFKIKKEQIEDDLIEKSENHQLFKTDLMLTCEVCSNDFEKRDKYAKHLQNLHGFKCIEKEIDSSIMIATKINENDDEVSKILKKSLEIPSKYVAVVKKIKNPLYLCLVCKTETTSKMSARKHFRTHGFWTSVKCDSRDIGYKCRFCSNLFWTVEKRNRHQVTQHLTADDEEKFMKCYVCMTVFSSKTCLKRHVQIEHSTSQTFTTIAYKCLHCCKLFPNLSSVRAHFEKDHPSSKSLYCGLSECRTKCSSKKVLRSHYKRLHTEPKLYPRKCDFCDKSLKSVHSMHLHMKIKHGDSKPGFKCRACEDRFNSDMERKAHMQTEHPGVSTFFCKFCDKSFRSKSGLNGHVQMHREINLSCPHCQKKFTRRDSYLEHLLIHNGPRHRCNICEKEFVQRSNLIRHTRTHTGDKPYFCRYCFKRFADKGACTSHERVHTREEVSACPFCNKTFSKKQKLKYHIRKHTGEGLEKCNICEKSFTSGYSLKKHMQTHERTSIKATCECGKSFTCEEYLQRHVRITHGKPVDNKATGTSVFSFYCQICPKGYNTKAKLNDHIVTHSSNQNIKCAMCDFKANKKFIIREHLTKNHGIPDEEHGSCYELFDSQCDISVTSVMNQEEQDIDDKTALHVKLFS